MEHKYKFIVVVVVQISAIIKSILQQRILWHKIVKGICPRLCSYNKLRPAGFRLRFTILDCFYILCHVAL